MIVLFWCAGNSGATSPIPEEVKPGETATACTTHSIVSSDHEKGIFQEKTSSFAFEVSEAKRDVLEWVTKYVNNKLNEWNVSEFKIGCSFPRQ